VLVQKPAIVPQGLLAVFFLGISTTPFEAVSSALFLPTLFRSKLNRFWPFFLSFFSALLRGVSPRVSTFLSTENPPTFGFFLSWFYLLFQILFAGGLFPSFFLLNPRRLPCFSHFPSQVKVFLKGGFSHSRCLDPSGSALLF